MKIKTIGRQEKDTPSSIAIGFSGIENQKSYLYFNEELGKILARFLMIYV